MWYELLFATIEAEMNIAILQIYGTDHSKLQVVLVSLIPKYLFQVKVALYKQTCEEFYIVLNFICQLFTSLFIWTHKNQRES